MPNPALKLAPRKVQAQLLAKERKLRKTGDWGEWERIENPRRFRPGWLGEVDYIVKNRVFSVLVRNIGVTCHLAVTSLSGKRPTWHEMQRIKNEIAGEDQTAVEVYPPQSEVVDGADMFHIWLVAPLPFSLNDDRHKEADR